MDSSSWKEIPLESHENKWKYPSRSSRKRASSDLLLIQAGTATSENQPVEQKARRASLHEPRTWSNKLAESVRFSRNELELPYYTINTLSSSENMSKTLRKLVFLKCASLVQKLAGLIRLSPRQFPDNETCYRCSDDTETSDARQNNSYNLVSIGEKDVSLFQEDSCSVSSDENSCFPYSLEALQNAAARVAWISEADSENRSPEPSERIFPSKREHRGSQNIQINDYKTHRSIRGKLLSLKKGCIRRGFCILSSLFGECVSKKFVTNLSIEIAITMLPLIIWFSVFSLYPLLSLEWRPAINTTLLPKLEGLLHFPYRWFATRSSQAADFIAAIPYTIHAILPGMFFLYLLFMEGKKAAFCFFVSLGVMNTVAVLTQILFPVAPPWYFELNAFARAEHWMKGNPGAALSRVDRLFGIVFYRETYTTQNRIPFGSFPSLHAAWPSLVAFCFPCRGSHLFKVLAVCYVGLIYWAAMYLQHHYVIDLVGGTLYAYVTYRLIYLKRIDLSDFFRKSDRTIFLPRSLHRPPLQSKPKSQNGAGNKLKADAYRHERREGHCVNEIQVGRFRSMSLPL
eukprot:jgi/Galph1/130/GphlegSOOS_G4854.1